MSLFTPEKRAGEWGNAHVIPAPGDGGSRPAGELVTPTSAMRLSTAWACRRLIGETIATFPWRTYRIQDHVRVPVDKEPDIIRRPSSQVSAIGWRRQVIDALVGRGNVWGIVGGTDVAGRPTMIDIVDNDLITVMRSGQTGKYTFRYNNAPITLFENGGDLWHRAANEQPGSMLGMSVLEYAATAMGLGLAAQRFGADWFGRDAQPQALISKKGPLNDPDGSKSKKIKDRFKAAVRSRDVIVMGDDLTYTQIQVAANESQFLETIQANKTTICDFYGVQAEMVNGSSGASLTYANVEQRLLHLLILCLQPWTVRLEAIFDELTARPFAVRADFDALLRPDSMTRAQIDVMNVRAGIWSPNYVLQKNYEPGFDGGDQHNWPPFANSVQHEADPATGEAIDPTAADPAASTSGA